MLTFVHRATEKFVLARLCGDFWSGSTSLPKAGWRRRNYYGEMRIRPMRTLGSYFQSDHKYTTVMTAQGESLLRTPLHELLAKLDPNHFKQIHRSTIVNMRMVAAVVRDDSGRGTMRLKNRPETLPVSLTFMPLFKNM